MRNRLLPLLSLPVLMLPAVAMAEVPSVAVDIPPVHSLVSRVMGELGSPELVIQPGASPHGYSMRISEARSLADADIVFFVSDELTPWLAKARASLAADADTLELMEVPGTLHLRYREGATFEAHHHDDEVSFEHDEVHGDHEEHHDGDHEEHGDHDEHHDGGHEAHAEHDEHHDSHDDHHEHAHAGMNPHGWLDPMNARLWLAAIAESLAAQDPEHAATYRRNAQTGQRELDAMTESLSARLAQVQGTRYIVFHDAYQYFEHRFDAPASGAISLGDASTPSPARVKEIQARVARDNIQCVFREPQYNPALIESVFEGTGVKTSIVFEPLGVGLPLGETLYPQLIERLGQGILRCADA
ncbi:zinc ABC transporter substrate-binding protein [Cobetia sp. 14N.309.X.WAT.E.A4]|uniref:zinc ABC transporter substrate-binding protein n=1 Tax=Cobetia sp. 14N.309.X.WAT.E.A4 TaxID=2998323 RepID=UPI0025AF9BBF|nr:zinc ABC transporter substrate-binding protein [Cobetia sp. 14N.309.X.WAT.E.A4]MDN2657849.1 zinc ABC transporter substrate-binding protein [Cobetia sp. 14N.309.X.WAT.E.A4]